MSEGVWPAQHITVFRCERKPRQRFICNIWRGKLPCRVHLDSTSSGGFSNCTPTGYDQTELRTVFWPGKARADSSDDSL